MLLAFMCCCVAPFFLLKCSFMYFVFHLVPDWEERKWGKKQDPTYYYHIPSLSSMLMYFHVLRILGFGCFLFFERPYLAADVWGHLETGCCHNVSITADWSSFHRLTWGTVWDQTETRTFLSTSSIITRSVMSSSLECLCLSRASLWKAWIYYLKIAKIPSVSVQEDENIGFPLDLAFRTMERIWFN